MPDFDAGQNPCAKGHGSELARATLLIRLRRARDEIREKKRPAHNRCASPLGNWSGAALDVTFPDARLRLWSEQNTVFARRKLFAIGCILRAKSKSRLVLRFPVKHATAAINIATVLPHFYNSRRSMRNNIISRWNANNTFVTSRRDFLVRGGGNRDPPTSCRV